MTKQQGTEVVHIVFIQPLAAFACGHTQRTFSNRPYFRNFANTEGRLHVIWHLLVLAVVAVLIPQTQTGRRCWQLTS